ncbi:M23 family metallopeptidase [Planobacterium oryzisoli]|uniref:M23 family metallopeptidase n=1 Tax=Planobacterium oryzisoli TaxID=2771435 RepID=A0A930YV72_9FLAO|nr:M23 family metallopeptidase [Planobacterium oryzisoli]MBF5026958.1 M23 family metallopeptidase [Planobacterium oryzisoli]
MLFSIVNKTTTGPFSALDSSRWVLGGGVLPFFKLFISVLVLFYSHGIFAQSLLGRSPGTGLALKNKTRSGMFFSSKQSKTSRINARLGNLEAKELSPAGVLLTELEEKEKEREKALLEVSLELEELKKREASRSSLSRERRLFLLAYATLGTAHVSKIEKQDSTREHRLPAAGEPLSNYSLPLKGPLVLTSSYGPRLHPVLGKRMLHQGADFRAHFEPVYAVLPGVVLFSGEDKKGGGLMLKIKHPGGLESLYLHLSELYYRRGERVEAGFTIARSGNSGRSSGPHLHFAVHREGQPIDPTKFLLTLVSPGPL